MIDTGFLYALGFSLVIVGILIIVFAFLRRPISGEDKGHVRGGGVVIKGPIPIVFGTDKKSVKILLLLSIVLTVLVLASIITSYLLSR